MPPGSMTWNTNPFREIPLGGYSEQDCNNVISIQYHIPSGTKDGMRYHGTSRVAYLPDN